jgi:SsrA-binding protein
MSGEKTVITNRRAHYDYFIEDTFEAGIVLKGTEVKSLRAGKGNLQDAYATIEHGEVYLNNMHISPYEQGNRYNHDPLRPRKLLLHKQEIRKLIGKVKERGYTLVPLRVYFSRGLAKVELAMAKGKRQYDKRQDMAKRDAAREVERVVQDRERGSFL